MLAPPPDRLPVGTTAVDPRTPNLFIIGAPKAGTTFVHAALGRVPSVYMTRVKEPGFFASEREQRRGVGYYLDAYFSKAAGHAIRGESTPWYLYSELARQGIADLRLTSPPRLLVLVRRPADRAYSMYLDQVRLGRENRTFEAAVEEELAGLAAGKLDSNVRQRYVWCGLYSEHIERWQSDFGAEHVHVLCLERLTADPLGSWQELAAFLEHDLGPSRLEEVGIRDRNGAGALRWPRVDAFVRSFEGGDHPLIEGAKRVLPPGLHRRVLQRVGRLNRTPAPDLGVDSHQAILRALDDYFQAEAERLGLLMGRRLTEWEGRLGDVDHLPSPPAPVPNVVRPLRVLHLVARSHRRGAELAAVELADELDRRGHHNSVVALGPATDGGQETGMVPLVSSVGVGLPDLLSRAWKVRRLLAEDPPDVVFAHGGWAAQVIALAAPRRGPVLVWQRILGFPPTVWQPGRRWWWQIVARRFDVGVALTAELEAELRRLGFDRPIWVIANSRHPDRFLDLDRRESAAELRAELDVPEDVALVGFVGHLVHQKRPERALEVLARVLEQGRAVHLVIAGGGPLRPTLEREVRKRKLDPFVTFLGHRPDVERVLGGVELVLLTSDLEGIPGVAIEALMSGCPVVTFPAGGVSEVVQDGVTGVVLSAHDPALMADAVVRLLDDDSTREAMSREGRLQTVRFSSSLTADVYAERLESFLSQR